ncbi:hypothetical protein [Psychromonas sp. CD1]|uniref:hypothetical protein n=1 Tax=Psychromonas sp. CD1 TaxID=1979839 RepID=UPI000B9BC0D4|nr:hypothetical protein [Psychromonas sp. CD1]
MGGLPISDVLFLLIGPEHLLIRLDENSSGEVIDVLFLGAHLQLKVIYKGMIYLLKQSAQQSISVGSIVVLELLDHEFVFFDVAS